jgi:tetratricopeptide (TPR) repeat protein
MDRRKFLTVLTPFVAGCFGGRREQPTTPADGGGTEAPGSTPEPTPESTPEPTPETSAEAAERLDAARDHLTEAVYVYVGDVSDDLTAVTAETEDFRPRDVLLKLDAVQQALYAAESAATTSEQRQAVEDLQTVQTFLTHATDLQSWLIDGHDAATSAYELLDDGDVYDAIDDLDAAVDDLDRVSTVVDETEDPLTTITDETDAASTDATDAITSEGYSEKLTQLQNEQSVLDTLESALTDLTDGAELIDDALDEEDAGRYDDAGDTADRAYDLLTEVEEQLSDLADDMPAHTDAFEDLVDDLADTAASFATQADDIAERN